MPEAIRREAILEAARRCFAQLGFARTNMDEVARGAGLTKGGLYFHFSSKEELFKQVVLYLIKQGQELIPPEEMAREQPQAYVGRFLRTMADVMARDFEGASGNFRIYDEAWDKPATRKHLAAFYAQLREALANAIRHGQRQGVFSRGHAPETWAVLGIAMLDGLLLQCEISERQLPYAKRSVELVDLFLARLSA
jgi:AcrR family transcriptional regulator